MGNYTFLGGFENPTRGRQAWHFLTNVPKILDLKSSSKQIFCENWRLVPLKSGFFLKSLVLCLMYSAIHDPWVTCDDGLHLFL